MLTIGRWTVDPRDGTVTSNGCVTRLEPKVMAVLVELFEHQGEVVTHDELMRRVWLDTHVAPGALARTISILRRALEDDAKAPVYIHTVPKRGYRLQLAAAPARHSTADPSHLRRVALAVVLAMLALVPIADRPRVTRKPTLFTGRFVDRSRAGNESAYAYYARALAADPSSSDAHAGVAIAYAFRADYLPEPARWRSAAIDLAARAVAIDGVNPNAVKALALSHLKAGHFDEAARVYRRALAIVPGDLPIFNNLGIAYLSLGNIPEALLAFEKRLAGDPNTSASFLRLVEALVDAGFPDQATLIARRALLLEPYARQPQLLAARADLFASRYGEVRVRLERQLEVDAQCVRCRVQLGLIEQLAGRPSEAERRYRLALDAGGDRTAAALRLAQLCRLAGRREESDALLQQVASSAREAIEAGTSGPGPPWALAAADAVRGGRDGALGWLASAIDRGRIDADWDERDPLFAEVQDEPRFAALMATARLRAARNRDVVAAVMTRLSPTLDAIDRRFGSEPRLPMLRTDPPGWPTLRPAVCSQTLGSLSCR